jgi:hypothetical protein
MFLFIKRSFHASEVWILGEVIEPGVDKYWELWSMSRYSKKKWGKYANFIRHVTSSLLLNFVKILKSFSNKYQNSWYFTKQKLWKLFCGETGNFDVKAEQPSWIKFCIELGMTPVQTRNLLKLYECAKTVSRTLVYSSYKEINKALYKSERKVMVGCRFSREN